jgi:hypothetical protein
MPYVNPYGRIDLASSSTRRTPHARYTVEQARRELYALIDEFRKVSEPSGSLLDRAVEIGPRRQGGAWLVPEADAQAALDRIEELEEELEDIGIGLLLQERLARGGLDDDLSLEELASEVGREHLL